MKTSRRGIDLIKEFEGFRATAYEDIVGLLTIGYGTLINSSKAYLITETITEQEAEGLLVEELVGIETEVNRLVKQPINQNQFDSLASFCYNLGCGALRKSTLLKKINIDPGDPAIRTEFLKWHHAGGVDVTGLKRRRNAEADLYFSVG